MLNDNPLSNTVVAPMSLGRRGTTLATFSLDGRQDIGLRTECLNSENESNAFMVQHVDAHILHDMICGVPACLTACRVHIL